MNKIITEFSNKGIKMGTLDKITLSFLGHIQAGWIDLGAEKLSRGDFLKKLTTAKAALVDIILIPGETTAIFLRQSAAKLALDEKKLFKEYERQAKYGEGLLYPESYKFPRGISEEYFIRLMLELSRNASKNLAEKIFGEYNERKWHNFIITASVIQKEAASKEEMPIVASVIYNRLKNNMKLQMDGTLNYGFYSHTKVTPERIRNDESSYNTYKFAGLPKEAVCNVSQAAIRAAIFPAKTNYLYFVRDKSTGKHIFTTNLNDHNKAIQRQR